MLVIRHLAYSTSQSLTGNLPRKLATHTTRGKPVKGSVGRSCGCGGSLPCFPTRCPRPGLVDGRWAGLSTVCPRSVHGRVALTGEPSKRPRGVFLCFSGAQKRCQPPVADPQPILVPVIIAVVLCGSSGIAIIPRLSRPSQRAPMQCHHPISHTTFVSSGTTTFSSDVSSTNHAPKLDASHGPARPLARGGVAATNHHVALPLPLPTSQTSPIPPPPERPREDGQTDRGEKKSFRAGGLNQ